MSHILSRGMKIVGLIVFHFRQHRFLASKIYVTKVKIKNETKTFYIDCISKIVCQNEMCKTKEDLRQNVHKKTCRVWNEWFLIY